MKLTLLLLLAGCKKPAAVVEPVDAGVSDNVVAQAAPDAQEQATPTAEPQDAPLPGIDRVKPGTLLAATALPEEAYRTTESGLRIADIEVGSGVAVAELHKFTVDYTGWLADGTEFDSSMRRASAFSAALGRGMLIAGWEEGLQGMQPGGVRQLIVPSELAYGDKVRGKITANAELTYKIVLHATEFRPNPPAETRPLAGTPTRTPSGLQYYDFVVGDGAVATSGSVVHAEYNGFLESGAIFDSSYTRTMPIRFTLGQGRTIKGWEEGLMGMRVGGERKLIVPPELGYGSRVSEKIPANSTLIYDVKLVKIESE